MSWLKSVWWLLTIRCEETTRLISEACDRKLTFVERVAIGRINSLVDHVGDSSRS